MRYYVEINGNSSLDITGLAIKELPPITKPLIRSQIEEIDGRDGDIITELGYSAYDKSIEIGLYGSFDIDEIIKYFTGEGTITFSNEPDKFYYFKLLNQIDYEKLLKFKTAVVTFHCQPFKYPVEETPIEGEAITVTGSGSNITLQNTVVAPIDMKLYGNTSQTGTPTPSSPQPIHTVSGDNSINVVGKNLFDKDHVNNLVAYIPSSGTISYGANNYFVWIPIQQNTNYAVSFTQIALNTATVADNIQIGLYENTPALNVTGTRIYTDTRTSATQDYTYTTTFNSETYNYVGIKVAEITRTDATETLKTLQIEVGTTATTYEPYQSNNYSINLGYENLLNPYGFINNSNTGMNVTKNKITLTALTTTGAQYVANFVKNVDASKSYTFKCKTKKVQLGSAGSPNCRVIIYGSNNDSTYTTLKDLLQTNPVINQEYTLSGTLTGYKYYRFYFYNNGSTPVTLGETTEYYEIMFNEGEAAKTYTPYGENIELGEIADYDDRTFKSTGKNLLNLNNQSGSTDGVVYKVNNDVIKLTGSNTNTTTHTLFSQTTNIPNFEIGQTYTLYLKGADINKNYMQINYNDGTSNKALVSTASNKLVTFTIPNDFKYAYLIIVNAKGTSTSHNEGIMPMLVKGEYTEETIGEFEPYGINWFVEKQIDKIRLSGSWNWNVSNTGTDNYIYYAYPSPSIYVKTGTDGLCTHYPYHSIGNDTYQGIFWASTFFRVRYGTEEPIADYKTWLNNNDVMFYYVLDIPTYTKIENEELINQLEALHPHSYNPTTNITQTNNDAPFELDVSLSYTNTMNINNVGNIYAKPILTIEGSGNIGIILNDIEILSVDLGEGGKIAIDVPNLQAYNPDDDTLLNRYVTGDYMKLLIQEGDNTIAFSGSVTSATLQKYTRWI